MAQQLEALSKLTHFTARRSQVHLLVWAAAIVIPVVLQIVSGGYEELRDYLAGYYGPITLFMFFVMSFSFAVVFSTYYVIGGLQGTGSFDLLRLSRQKPREIIMAVDLALLKILIPPMLVFFTAFYIYLIVMRDSSTLALADLPTMLGFVLSQIFNVILLVLILSAMLFRPGPIKLVILALFAGLVAVVLNMLPVMAIVVWQLHPLLYLAALIALCVALYFLDVARLQQAWRPQKLPAAG